MADSSVESLDDEELLMYYETTKKLLERRMKDEAPKMGKWEFCNKNLSASKMN